MLKKRKFDDIEKEIFHKVGVDPNAPVDINGIDKEIVESANKTAATEAIHHLLSNAKPNYTEATGNPAGGKRRKTRRRSKKSKKRKSKRRRYRK